MKTGAEALMPTLEGSIFTDNAWSTLGLGWLGACIVLSGSPVAASALTLLDGGAIDREQAFTMLTGSRLGAAFVVLVVGVVYALRRSDGGSRRAPISIGILSLLMTVVYVRARRDPRLRAARTRRVRRHRVRHVAVGSPPRPTRSSGGPSTPPTTSCPGGRCSRSASSCCSPASRCSTRSCPTVERRPARAPRRGVVRAQVADVPASAAGCAC